MELLVAIVILIAALWLSGRNWETRSPYPAVRLHGDDGHTSADRTS